MTTFLDYETTFHTDDRGVKSPSPYIPENYAVSVGWALDGEDVEYRCLQHNDAYSSTNVKKELQDVLDNTSLLVAHNAKFELTWTWACGLIYTGPIYDTMLSEFIAGRGTRPNLKLEDVALNLGVSEKKSYLVDEYFSKGISSEAIPWEVLEEYGVEDVIVLREIFYKQLLELKINPDDIIAEWWRTL